MLRRLNAVRLAFVGACTAAALLGLASACLPDLAPVPLPVTDGGPRFDATPAPGCGDGIIATNEDGGDAGESCDPGANPGPGCSDDCTISCSGRIGPSGHCYFVADPSENEQANRNCNAAGAHVVTIGSSAEAALVRDLVDGGTYRVGLVLEDDLFSVSAYKTPPSVEEPGWPHAATRCPGCFAVGADDAGSFAAEPGDDAGASHCLAAVGDRWVQVPCRSTLLTVCEREPLGRRAQACGGPLCTTLASTAGTKRYVIANATASATAADEFCRSYPGGSLAVFDSREEREQLAHEILAVFTTGQQHPPLGVWIGLAHDDATDTWLWADGTPASGGARPEPWANGEPAQNAKGRAFMRLDTTAFDTQLVVTGTDDTTPRLFVCQRPPPDAGR